MISTRTREDFRAAYLNPGSKRSANSSTKARPGSNCRAPIRTARLGRRPIPIRCPLHEPISKPSHSGSSGQATGRIRQRRKNRTMRCCLICWPNGRQTRRRALPFWCRTLPHCTASQRRRDRRGCGHTSDRSEATADNVCGEMEARSRIDPVFLERYFGHASAWANQCAITPTSCDKWRAVVAAALLDAGRIVELAVLRNFKFTALGKAGRAE